MKRKLILSKNIWYVLLLTIFSYWYNLAVLNYSIAGQQDLRLFDITFLYLILNFYSKPGQWREYIKTEPILNSLNRFVLWCGFGLLVMAPVFLVGGKGIRTLQAILYFYHLIGFFVAAVMFKVYWQDSAKRTVMRKFIVSLIFFQGVLLILQFAGIIPILWDSRWIEMYGVDYPSGTLGPNRIVPGMFMFFGLIFSLANSYWNTIEKGVFKMMNNSNILISSSVIIMLGSKTTWLTFLLFLFLFIIFNIKNIGQLILRMVLASMLLLTLTVSFVNLDPMIERINFVIEDRVTTDEKKREDQYEGSTAIAGIYAAHSTGRFEMAILYIGALADNWWYIFIGSGITSRALIGDSAHNMYLNLIGETGIPGLILYLVWLSACYSFLKRIDAGQKIKVGIPFIITMVISLFFGEHLYVYRSAFATLGFFLIVLISFEHADKHENNRSHSRI